MALKSVFARVKDKLFHGTEDPTSTRFEVAVRCDKGKVRDENQDRAGVFKTSLGHLLIVADGVGGLSGGALAAEMAVEGYTKYLGTLNRSLDPAAALQEATAEVNAAIGNKHVANQQSMGSTVALALLRHKTAYIGHAGDSRVYLIRADALSRLTRDHSIVQKMIDRGIISDLQARSHPDASVLTRSLGQKTMELEISQTQLIDGDALLLCSDGLWGYVDEVSMQTIACSTSLNAEQTADALLTLALEGGGADNISIIFLKLVSETR